MAMIQCPECRRPVSDRAATCPTCGHPIAGAPVLAPGAPAGGYGISSHLSPQILLQRFPDISAQVPEEVRSQLGGREAILYFNYIDKTGGCSSGSTAKQWIMVTASRVMYRASLEQVQGSTTTFAETAGAILLPQISYVGMAKTEQQGCGCTGATTYKFQINSSGGSIVIAMPTEQHVTHVRQFLDAVLSPY
jgi:hypothetical protein